MKSDMNINKKQGSLLAVYGIILVVYSVLFFAVPIPKGPAAWVSYLFSVISIGAAAAVSVYVFGKDDGITSKFYGFPIFKVGNLYALVQVIFGTLITIIDVFVKIPLWIVFIVSIVLLGAAAIGLIASVTTREIVETQEKEVERQTKTMTYFKLDMENMVEICKEPQVKKAMEELAEKFRYSDPVSNEALEEIEGKLKAEVAVLGGMLGEEKEAVLKKITEIGQLLADRNRRCKALKK